jgi:hypothetical protein
MHAMIDLPPRMTSRLAVFSTCGTRRYWLRRNLTCATARHVLWIMMNPSRADAQFNDATTTTTTNISARHGYDVHGVVNLSAQIEPNSANLAAASGAPDPVNDVAIERALVLDCPPRGRHCHRLGCLPASEGARGAIARPLASQTAIVPGPQC